MGYTEGSDLASAPFHQNPQVSAVEGPWSITPEEERIQMGRCCQDMHKENEQLRAQLAAAEKTMHEQGIRLNNYAHFFEAMRGLVLDSFNQITDADNPYQALERAFDKLAIR